MIKTKLRDYQALAVSKAIRFDGYGLFAEQRTGKCLMSLAVVDHRKPDRLLIICPVIAVSEWKKQIKKHLKLDWKCEIELINFEWIQRQRHAYKDWLKRIKPGEVTMTIVDECHRIKKRGSKQSRACRLIRKYSKYRLALTGTPLSKKHTIEDAWAQYDFIEPAVFGKYEQFEARYLTKGGFKGKKIVSYRNKKEFMRKFHSQAYRVTLREVRKVPLLLRRVKIRIEQSRWNQRLTKAFTDELKAVVNKVKIQVPHTMNLASKLQQITGGYLIDNDGSLHKLAPQEKMTALKQLLQSVFYSNPKVVICARYSHEVRDIAAQCAKLNRTVKTIEGGVKFNNEFDTDVIVVQIQSGLAIDLSAAKIIIWYSWDWSYINHEQMRFRVLSYSTRQIVYYYLMVKNSIDEDYYKAIVEKKKLADLICDRYRREIEQ